MIFIHRVPIYNNEDGKCLQKLDLNSRLWLSLSVPFPKHRPSSPVYIQPAPKWCNSATQLARIKCYLLHARSKVFVIERVAGRQGGKELVFSLSFCFHPPLVPLNDSSSTFSQMWKVNVQWVEGWWVALELGAGIEPFDAIQAKPRFCFSINSTHILVFGLIFIWSLFKVKRF